MKGVHWETNRSLLEDDTSAKQENLSKLPEQAMSGR